jgi:hypothetical protein
MIRIIVDNDADESAVLAAMRANAFAALGHYVAQREHPDGHLSTFAGGGQHQSVITVQGGSIPASGGSGGSGGEFTATGAAPAAGGGGGRP